MQIINIIQSTMWDYMTGIYDIIIVWQNYWPLFVLYIVVMTWLFNELDHRWGYSYRRYGGTQNAKENI